ncbi:MAG TPA: transposase [Acidimicrobiales bacterium]|nr:transposase [Acidimicrobiales bacterium]
MREGDRDQLWLVPPSVADWLPKDHLAWFVLDVVKELDLSGFYASYRADGRGGATYGPETMLAVLLYAYCTGERSSRRIERRCVEDVAYRVLAANQHPDHATLARFRQRHEDAVAELFAQILQLCVEAGLVDAGVVAIDGTKMEADASSFANRTKKQLAEEILREAERSTPRKTSASAIAGATSCPRNGPPEAVGPSASAEPCASSRDRLHATTRASWKLGRPRRPSSAASSGGASSAPPPSARRSPTPPTSPTPIRP